MHIIFIPLLIASLLPWSPRPSDAALIRGSVFYTQVDGSQVSGYLPTPCHELRINQTEARLDIYSVLAPGTMCDQTLYYFSVDIMPEHNLLLP